MDRKPIHQKIYQDVLDEFQAKDGDSYNEVKHQLRSEYERRCNAYLPGEGVWEGDVTKAQEKRREKFVKKYHDRGRLKPFK